MLYGSTVLGIDSSQEMLNDALSKMNEVSFRKDNRGTTSIGEKYDLVFSNTIYNGLVILKHYIKIISTNVNQWTTLSFRRCMVALVGRAV